MKFYSNISDLEKVNGKKVFKITKQTEEVVDVWVSEGEEDISEGRDGMITYRKSEEGIFGSIECEIKLGDGNNIESTATTLYRQIFKFITELPEYKLVRIWNYVPIILGDVSQSAPDLDIYRCFNRGRYKAFSEKYGQDMEKWIIPAASAVGSTNNVLKIEFFVSKEDCIFFENKVQTPAYHYSAKYGKLPPVFSRGALYKFKDEILLISSGTASVLNEDSSHINDIYKQVRQSIENLLILVSSSNLQQYSIDDSFDIQDLVLLRVYYKSDQDRDFIEEEIRKSINAKCQICFMKADICRDNLLVEIEGIFQKKGIKDHSNSEKEYAIKN
ncbi:hypothetical protein [Lysinibacillus sp. NPDC092081]|uniref:chorismate transformation enzyme, FkbO/Hyg5 family n=1 Tax=Lysinibacillus sp. NPDC092081 TaxID=3364131 RepID=UPI00382B6344